MIRRPLLIGSIENNAVSKYMGSWYSDLDYALIAGLQDSGSVIGGAVLCLHNVCSLSAQVRKSGVAVGCADGKTVRSLNEDHKRIRVNGVAGWTTSRFDD